MINQMTYLDAKFCREMYKPCRAPTDPTYTEQVITETTARVERIFREKIMILEAEITRLLRLVK